jgi:membrane protein DedA with SNARE-associated domain
MANLLLAHVSYLSIFIVLVLTGSGLPIPEEVPIIVAGVLSAPPNAKLDPWLAFMWCLLGAIVGDCVMYFIGYHFGRPVLREHPWFARFVTPEREIQIEQQFRQHGLKVFFVARFLVGIRSPVYLTAGILRVSFRRFLMIDLFCAAVVVGTFFWLAYLFGEPIAKWVQSAEVVLTIVVVVAMAIVVLYLWRRYKRKLAPAGADPDGNPQSPGGASGNSSQLKSSASTPVQPALPPEREAATSPGERLPAAQEQN